MIEAKVSTFKSLRREGIQELVQSPGPCISLLLPPYRPGEQAMSTAALLKATLRNAAWQLGERKVPKPTISELLEPLQELVEDQALPGGCHWSRAIFRSPSVFRQLQLSRPMKSALTIAGCFEIRAVLAELYLPPEFYLLTRSKNRIGLLRCTDLRAEPVGLPRGVPETLEEALSLEPPDHDLENRSAAGGSTGSMRAVRFGTGCGRETQHVHLADFHQVVDRGLHAFLHARGAPLVLMGVAEDTCMYRSVNTYPNLVDKSLHGSADGFLHEADSLLQAFAIVRAAYVEREAKSLAELKERVGPGRFSHELDRILRSAFEGRVSRLYVDEGTERIDVFERGGYRSCGKEDLLNLATVQTMLHGGQAFALPSDMMPDGAAAVAILRF